MVRYHNNSRNQKIAEIVPDCGLINNPEDMLEIMVDAAYNGCNHIILHEMSLDPGFFDLKTGLAGGILQKLSNYRMKLSIVGNFTKYKSESLNAFISESNKKGDVCFVGSLSEAITRSDQ